MRNKGPRASDSQGGFLWDTSNPALDTPQETTTERHRRLRPRTLLAGSTALVLVAGAAYAAEALSTPSHHENTANTAGAALLPQSPAPVDVVATTPGSPSPSKSVTPSKSPTTTAPRVVTVVTSVAAVPSSQAPVTTRPAASPAFPAPVGDWLLNQTTGNVAVDSTGAHNGWASDGWWTGGSEPACLFDGTDSQIYTSGPVLSTGAGESFTVSAWVYMSALPVAPQYDETAVSQDADQDSSFYLQFTLPSDRWAFSRVDTDSDNSPSAARALSQSAPSLSTWTHLVGVYDAAAGTQSLYVNGVFQSTVAAPAAFSSSGDLAMGRALYNGKDTDWLKGAIRKVEVFDVALDASQVGQLS